MRSRRSKLTVSLVVCPFAPVLPHAFWELLFMKLTSPFCDQSSAGSDMKPSPTYPLKTEFLLHKNLVRTSQETHYVSATKPDRLLLFGETVAVYCENHTEHTDTLCVQNVEFVPHRKHITSPLQSPTGYCCLGKRSLFVVRTVRNTQIHCVGRM
jgi:hypothetical protein